MTQAIANKNQAQKEYAEAKRQAVELTKLIQRAVLDMPAACNGDWSKVGDAKRTLCELQAIADRLLRQGEYA